MTYLGTRPPTVDEWDKYELHHRARLATKPGLTGMWQVSGRSNITDLVISNLMLTGVQTGQIAVAQTINEPFAVINVDDYYGKEAFINRPQDMTVEQWCDTKGISR